ncbi:hypothetical protein [Streptomyces sp. NPDC054866]
MRHGHLRAAPRPPRAARDVEPAAASLAATHRTVTVDGIGDVETWVDVTGVSLPLVSFRHTFVLAATG